jgi:hypothetical protein
MIVGCLDCFIVLELIVNFPVFIIKFFFFLKNIFYEFSGFYIKETGKKKKKMLIWTTYKPRMMLSKHYSGQIGA